MCPKDRDVSFAVQKFSVILEKTLPLAAECHMDCAVQGKGSTVCYRIFTVLALLIPLMQQSEIVSAAFKRQVCTCELLLEGIVDIL